MALVRRLIRHKKFHRYLSAHCYPIAIDGTQKLVRTGPWWAEGWLEHRRDTADGETMQQYVYVLEAKLVFHNGAILPLLSEFLNYAKGDPVTPGKTASAMPSTAWRHGSKRTFPDCSYGYCSMDCIPTAR